MKNRLYDSYMKAMYDKPTPEMTELENLKVVVRGLLLAISKQPMDREFLNDLSFRIDGGYDNFYNPPKETDGITT